MTGKFILSLDCEGKWGVADHLTAEHHRTLSDDRLRSCYRDILALLDEYNVPATFAFVGAFTLSETEFRVHGDALDSFAAVAPHYIAPALDDCRNGSREGWLADWSVGGVEAAKTAHEIACHGPTHLPWDNNVSEQVARTELALLDFMPAIKNSKTYIFPRNYVGHTDILSEYGFVGYRAAKSMSRIVSLASEFNIFSPAEADFPLSRPLAIPAGYFVNWKSGLRKSVPTSLSALRARNMLKAAAQNGRSVHYWTHPENIASAPQTLDVLRAIIQEAAYLRDAGKIEIMTQIDYCTALTAA